MNGRMWSFCVLRRWHMVRPQPCIGIQIMRPLNSVSGKWSLTQPIKRKLFISLNKFQQNKRLRRRNFGRILTAACRIPTTAHIVCIGAVILANLTAHCRHCDCDQIASIRTVHHLAQFAFACVRLTNISIGHGPSEPYPAYLCGR